MNIVIINVYAEGYYSNSEYKEYVVVSEDFYNKNKDKIDKIINKGYYIADLDGKYSEIEADIYVSYIADEDIEEEFWGYERNGEDFYCTMYDKFNKESGKNFLASSNISALCITIALAAADRYLSCSRFMPSISTSSASNSYFFSAFSATASRIMPSIQK